MKHWIALLLVVLAPLSLFAAEKDYIPPDEVAAALAKRAPEDVSLGHGAWNGDVYVLPYTFGSTYDSDSGGGLNVLPREWVAKTFYQDNPDAYDFIVVFTNFDFNTQEARAFYIAIKNDVQGIGIPVFDSSSFFGSAKLQGYVDGSKLAGYLTSDGTLNQNDLTLVLNHEIGHRWLAHPLYMDASGHPSSALLGKSASHWSYLLDSNASYLYGSKWKANPDGTYTAAEIEQRYSALDLYLMGLAPKEEVSPLTLLINSAISNEQIPQLGATLSAQSSLVTIENIVAANGSRLPDYASSPKESRVAFVYLMDPATTASPADLELLNSVRSVWRHSFFQQTGGRGVVSVDRGVASGSGGGLNLSAGASWLIGVQQTDGSWQDSADTTARETGEAISALEPFGSVYDSQVARALSQLPSLQTASTELLARKAESILTHDGTADSWIQELQARGSGSRGWGAFPRYASDPVTTARVIRAFAQAGQSNSVEQAWTWLTSVQNPDGGWGWRSGGPSSIYATLEVLLAAKFTRTGFWNLAYVQRAASWLLPRQTAGGFGEPFPDVPETSLFLQMAQDTNVNPQVLQAATGFLTSQQAANGSWSDSVYDTALALNALGLSTLPDPYVSSSEIYTDPESPFQNENVTLHLAVFAGNVAVPAGTPYRWDLIEAQTGLVRESFSGMLPAINANYFVLISDARTTTAPAGSYTLKFVIDPDRLTLDRNRNNNIVSIPFLIKSRANGVDLEALGFSSTPDKISSVPQSLTINGTVINHGQTDAASVSVTVFDGPVSSGLALGSTTISVSAIGSSPVSIPVIANQGKTYHLTIQAQPVDPPEEADPSNNTASVVVPLLSREDLEIVAGSFTANPSTAVAGDLVTLSASIRNSGSIPETGVQVGFSYSIGTPPVSYTIQLLTLAQTLQPGETLPVQVQWRPNQAGSFTVTAVVDPQDLIEPVDNPSRANNTANLTFTVDASTLPNLSVSPASLSISPAQPLQGQTAHIVGTISNLGSTVATSVDVKLRLDNPLTGPLLKSVHFDSLDAGEQSTIQIDWTVDQQQDRLIYVVADPGNTVSEYNEEDNQAFRVIDVQTLPDLVLSTGQIAWNPPFPAQNQSVHFSVTVLNTGDQPVSNAALQLVDANEGILAATTIPLIAAKSNAVVQFDYTPVSDGEQTLTVRINFDRTIAELSYDNNAVSFILPVQNGDIFLTEKFFSPNGDGVKDVTVLHFRIPASQVQIFNAQGEQVRTLAVDTPQSATWDGKSDSGRVVPDGAYELRVGVLSAWAIVDDNLISISSDPRTKLIDGSISAPNDNFISISLGPNEGDVFFVQVATDGSIKLYKFNGYDSREVGDWPSGQRLVACSSGADVCLSENSLIRYPGGLSTPLTAPLSGVPSLSPDGKWLFWFESVERLALQSTDNPGIVYYLSACSENCNQSQSPIVLWNDDSSELIVADRDYFLFVQLAPTPSVIRHSFPEMEGTVCHGEGEQLKLDAAADFEKGELYLTTGEIYRGYRIRDGELLIQRNGLPMHCMPASLSSSGTVLKWNGPGYVLYGALSGQSFLIDPALHHASATHWSPKDKYLFEGGPNYLSSSYLTVADNLMVALNPRILFGNAGVALKVLVADRNLDRFILEYADSSAPGQFFPIGAPSSEPIYGDLWGTWIPSHKARYIIRLTAYDLAGNVNSISKTITWNGDNDIANLYAETRYISPASSPGIKDNLIFHYIVLRPSNLIFRILDENERLVRTIPVAASQTGDATSLWDGKDDTGNFVPDGAYSLEYFGATWPVTVDNTPPAVSFSISNAEFFEALFRNTYSGTADDVNIDRWTLSSRQQESAGEWGTIQSGTYRIILPVRLPDDDIHGISWFAQKEFRFGLLDLAGNESFVQRFHREEQIHFTGSEPPCRTEQNPCIYPDRPPVDELTDNGGELDSQTLLQPDYNTFLIQNSVWGFKPSSLRLEYRIHFPVGAWNQGELHTAIKPKVRSVGDSFGIKATDSVWLAYWDHSQLLMQAYDVRLIAINEDGNEIISPTVLLRPQGLTLEYLTTDLSGIRLRVTNQTAHVLSVSVIAQQIWNEKLRTQDFGEDAPILGPGETVELHSGCGLFVSEHFISKQLTFQAIGSDIHQVPPKPIAFSEVIPYEMVSLWPYLYSPPVQTLGGCSNNPPPSGLHIYNSYGWRLDSLTHIVSPGSPAGILVPALTEPLGSTPQSMELVLYPTPFNPDDPGQVLASAPYPVTGSNFMTFNTDFSSYSQGSYIFSVRYRFADGQDGLLAACPLMTPLEIDRTAPTVTITSPHDGDTVCVPESYRFCNRSVQNFLPVAVGASSDAAELILARDGNQFWRDKDYCDDPASGYKPPGFVAESRDYDVTAQAWDEAGWVACKTIHFSTSSGIKVSATPSLFSPVNTQGRPTTSVITFDASIAGAYFINIKNPLGAVIRTASGNATQGQAVSFGWDGRDSAGNLVSNGLYTIEATLAGDCSSTSSVKVEVDTAPPSIAITKPASGDTVDAVLEARGLAIDKNFERYELQIRSVDACESCWEVVLLDAHQRFHPDDVLGIWDTGAYPSGSYEFRLWSIDRAGNVSNIVVPISVLDRTIIRKLSVVPNLISPLNGDGHFDQSEIRYALLQNALVTLQIQNAQGAAVKVFDAPGAYQPDDYVFVWDGSDQSGNPVSDGPFTLLLHAQKTDHPEEVEEAQLSIVVDNTRPETDITNIIEDGLYALPLAVRAFVQDPHLGDYTITLFDPNDNATVLKQDTGGLNDEEIATLENLPDGPYRIQIDATDRVLNAGSMTRHFVLDSSVPAAQILKPVAGAVINTQQAMVSLEGLVKSDHLDHYAWSYAAGENPQDTDFISIPTDNAPPDADHHIFANWDASALADGPYQLRLAAFDQLGRSQQDTISIQVDNTPPVVNITDPVEDAVFSGPYLISGLVSETNINDWTLEVIPEGGTHPLAPPVAQGITNVDGTLGIWSILPPDGLYQLHLTASDKAGNSAEVFVRVRLEVATLAPPILTATLQNRQDARLTWQPGQGSTPAGYNVYRDSIKINSSIVTGTEYIDAGLAGGTYIYTVRSVSATGRESADSNPVTIVVELTAPLAVIASPANGQQISGTIDILGTAYSSLDFKEYRLFTRPQTGSWLMLSRRTAPVVASVLGVWETTTIADGAYDVKLEAEDLSGNIATAMATVTVDNTAPETSPIQLEAILASPDPDGELNDIHIQWQYTNPPSDFAGYFLYRNGQLANAPGPVIGSQSPYLLHDPWYDDKDLPDGTYVYSATAADLAGNESSSSNDSNPITIETRRPHAVITSPEDGRRFSGSVLVQAESPDTDIVSLQFEYKTDSVWIPFGNALTHPPFLIVFIPPAYGPYEIRPVASDAFGADPNPSSITLIHVRAVPVLTARVDGGNVLLAWPAVADPYHTLQGYNVYRDGVKINTATVTDLAFTDSDLPDAHYNYAISSLDQNAESDRSGPAGAHVYTPYVYYEYPITENAVSDISGFGVVTPGVVELQRKDSQGNFITVATGTSESGLFLFAKQSLLPGLQVFHVVSTDPAGNRSKPSNFLALVSHLPPEAVQQLHYTAGAGNVQLNWLVSPDPDTAGFRITRDGNEINETHSTFPYDSVSHTITASSGTGIMAPVDGNLSTGWEPETFPAVWQWSWPEEVQLSDITLNWEPSHIPDAFDVDIFSQGEWLWWYARTSNTDAENTIPAPLKASAVRIRVGSPDNPPLLDEIKLQTTQRTQELSYSDENLTPSIYGYSVEQLNRWGQVSPDQSVTVFVDVNPPVAPVLAVDAADGCGQLRLSWELPQPFPGELAGYNIYRAKTLDGIYEQVASPDASESSYSDWVPMAFFYKITARGTIGGVEVESPASNPATAQPHCFIPPGPPVITAPTTAGNPITVQIPTADISGTAVYGSIVHLIRNGREVAHVNADSGSTFVFPGTELLAGANTFVARQEIAGSLLDSLPISIELTDQILPDALITGLAAFPPFPRTGDTVLISGGMINSGEASLNNVRLLLERQAPGGFPVIVVDRRLSLDPGQAASIQYSWETPGVVGDYQWILHADPDNEITEGNELNNLAQILVAVRPGSVVETNAVTDKPVYLPGQSVGIHVKVFSNAGPTNTVVKTVIEDPAGYLVAEVDSRTLPNFGPGTAEYDLVWPIPDIYPGNYRVHVTALQSGNEVASGLTPFILLPAMYITAQVSTGNTTYVAGDPIDISGKVKNLGQATVQNLTATFRVFSASNQVVASEVRAIDAIPVLTTIPLSWVWQSAGSPPGIYTIHLEVKNSSGVIVADAVPVSLTLTQPPVNLTGSLSLSSSALEPSQPLEVSASVTNHGTALQNVHLNLTIVNPQDLHIFGTYTSTVDLAPQQVYSFTHTFDTTGMPLGSYLVILKASGDSNGPFDVPLAQAGFTLIDSTAPHARLISPGAGLICDQAFLQAQAWDSLSDILRVFYTMDQGSQEFPLPALSTHGMFGTTWTVPAGDEGSHQFSFVAQDLYGNSSNAIVLPVSNDATPPVLDIQPPDGACLTPSAATFSAADPHLSSVAASLNGASYASGTVISTEGAYELMVTAADACGHTAAETRHFIIDQTAPSIDVTGVTDGAAYSATVTPEWTIQDLHLASSQALLNGQAVESGAVIENAGSYTLDITASDCAQNQSHVIIHFHIGLAPVLLMVHKNPADQELPDLSWTGNSPPYRVYRSIDCSRVMDGFLASTTPRKHTDTAPPVAMLICYNVMETAPFAPEPALSQTEPTGATVAPEIQTAECPDASTLDYKGLTADHCATPKSFVAVHNQAELDAYERDFGWNGVVAQNLHVDFSPEGSVVILSPCLVTLNGARSPFDIHAGKVCVYGRNGVQAARGISASRITLVSEEAGSGTRDGIRLSADQIYIRGKKAVWIGRNDAVSVTGPVTIVSDGDAFIGSNTQLTAAKLTVQATKRAYLGEKTVVNTTGPVLLLSTGNSAESTATINQGSRLTASDLRIEASKVAAIGEDAVVQVNNTAALISRDAAAGSQAILQARGSVSGQSLSMNSGNRTTLDINSAVQVVGQFNMSGVNCTIAAGAVIWAGSRTGTCVAPAPVSGPPGDHTPPESAISSNVPLDSKGTTDVPASALFTIFASDAGSGVARTWYRMDDETPVVYKDPFDLSGYTSGEHELCFYSQDNARNEEAPQCLKIRLTNATGGGGIK